MYDYITIERRYGSGGHEIATELSKRLKYRLCDRNVVVETCKRMELPYEQVSVMDEQNPIKPIFKPKGNEHLSLEDQIYNTEVEIIREAAEKPGCIFVGRCAAEILKDKKCLKVFITASDEFRMNRALTVEGLDASKAKDVMQKFDRTREKFFTTHSGAKWGSSEYFDLVLNSGELGISACVSILEQLAKNVI
ncbi:MAG: cytidylate kinase-like family protein [Lachnospiraceae bacterium]|nr:cytidylate kinase-like family protein [Lachnospiraceae bacterium]